MPTPWKPAFFGPDRAAAFRDHSVAQAYQHRPGYPDEAFDVLQGLIADAPARVLDVGCGTGLIARPLAERVEQVDALDVAPAMIDEGRRLPGGDHPRLRWIVGSAEDAPLDPPYALITFGDSLHWLDWELTLPRMARMLAPRGVMAFLEVGQQALPWDDELLAIVRRRSTNQDYQPFDVVAALEQRGLFKTHGRHTTRPVRFVQSIDAYIESFHGRSSFSRERMQQAGAFDDEVRQLVSKHAGPQVELQVVVKLTWGR